MDPFLLLHDKEEREVRAFHSRQTRIQTSIPGIIQSFDAAQMTCTVQPAIKAVVFDENGVAQDVPLPLLVDCPVQFPSGGGFTLTFPVKQGDECLVVFASRCIDAWWFSGGIQSQAELRMHDLSDGFAIPGIRSLPRALSGISTSSVQLRSDDGTTYLDISSGKIKLIAPTEVAVGATPVPLLTEAFYAWFTTIFMPSVTYNAGGEPPLPSPSPLTTILQGE